MRITNKAGKWNYLDEKKILKTFLNTKKENKVSLYQKFKIFLNKNKGFIYRVIIFMALILFSELLIFNRISWRFQLQFYIVFCGMDRCWRVLSW